MIMLPDLNEFYKTGFTTCILHKKYASKLADYVAQESWSTCNKEGFLIPEWMLKGFSVNIESGVSVFEKEFKTQQSIKQYTPEHYFGFFHTIFNSPLYNAGVDKIYNSKLKIDSIALWNGVGSGNRYWHWDGPGNGDIYALVYLSDYADFPASFGGGFEVGISNTMAQQDGYNDVSSLSVYYPDNGRILLGENRNPLYVHRTIAFTDQAPKNINRFTFLVTMKLVPNHYD